MIIEVTEFPKTLTSILRPVSRFIAVFSITEVQRILQLGFGFKIICIHTYGMKWELLQLLSDDLVILRELEEKLQRLEEFRTIYKKKKVKSEHRKGQR